MKKYSFPAFCFLVVSSLCSAQATYLDYPKAESVYKEFFTKYAVKDAETTGFISFQKKPDGWHVVVCKAGYDDIIKDDLIWSAQTKSFQHITYEPISDPDENKDELEKFTKDYTNIFFSYFPYYNYVGFDWDVIQDYKDKKNQPDSVVYALGRAYSYFADNLLSNKSGLSDKHYRFNISEGPNALSTEQLATYRKYHDMAIETFKKVQQLNPKYETMVGNISLKIADEYMVGYLDMMEFQNEEEANKELEGCTYDYFMISIAKDYLMSCDSNAILVTFGDNDTYPLLYIQAKYNFRKDILVVNNELLGLPFYINRMRKNFTGAQPLPLNISPDRYRNEEKDYTLFYNSPNFYFSAEHPSDLRFDMDFIMSSDTAQKVRLSNGDWANYMPSKYISFPVNKKNVQKSKIDLQTDDKATNGEVDTLSWEFKGNYLLKNSFILLNALMNNNWKRPFCFTTGGGEDYLGLNNYLKMKGFIYELVPIQNMNYGGADNPMIATGEDYDLIMHRFQWGNLSSGKYLGPGMLSLASVLRITSINLAGKLSDENKNDSALKVLNLCMDSMPEKYCPDELMMYQFSAAYYKAGDNTKGNTLSKELFNAGEKKLIGYGPLADAKPDKIDLITQSRSMLKYLLYSADKYKQHDLYKDYVRRLEALSAKGLFNKEDIAIKDVDK